MSQRPIDCQLRLRVKFKKKKSTCKVERVVEGKKKIRDEANDGGECRCRWRLFVQIFIKTGLKKKWWHLQGDGLTDRHLTRSDIQDGKIKPSAPRQADRQTGGINVNLIVHCSVVVSPLHPAKWLLINQPDLLLSYSVDRPLASASSGGGCYWSCTNDHQELLKHNSPPASVSPSLSACLPRSRS